MPKVIDGITTVRTLEQLSKPKVAIATVDEMNDLIRARQGHHVAEKVAKDRKGEINKVLYAHMSRMEDGVLFMVEDSRLPDGKVWKASLGGSRRETVNLDALRKSMLAHSIQPTRIEEILGDSQMVTDEETGKATLTQVVKVSQSDSVNVRMVRG